MPDPNNRRLRIAITDKGGATWTGGITYRKNLLEALRQYAPQTTVYLLSGARPEIAVESEWFKFLAYPPPNSRFPALVSKVTIRLFGYDYLLRRTLNTVPGGVDLIFPDRYTVGRRTAMLFWIPDFQYLHLPEMYSKSQIARLEARFRQGIERATLVVLSSQDAYQDFSKFAPEFAGKGRVLNFVAHIPPHLYDIDPMDVVRAYHLPEKFFYLPNQFWKHKNHKIVFKVLEILNLRGVRPYVVCTGNPVDQRNPAYFAELMQNLSLWGVRDQVAFLGLIPHDDVYRLIRQSICVLNPSLFEGWSTTVEEVKSVGKRLLLSDLPVHREQNPPGAIYFDPHNAEELATRLQELWEDLSPGCDIELEREAQEAYPTRLKHFANTFIKIANEAVDRTRGKKR